MTVPSSGGGEGEDAAAQPPRLDNDVAPSLSSSFPSDPQQVHEEQREELRALRQREHEIVALLGSSSPQRILHDIRNLLNEVQLLRYLAEKND